MSSLYPPVPFEIALQATPLSMQARRAQEWIATIRTASRGEWVYALDEGIVITILHFAAGAMQADLDNIVKPILDGLCRGPFVDDSQVKRLFVERFGQVEAEGLSASTAILERALSLPPPVVYIRVDTLESVEELWRR